MTEFKTFEDFYCHLIQSIENENDVYVFNYSYNDSDYVCIKEDKSIDYYVNWSVDMFALQRNLFERFGKHDEKMNITFDYVCEQFDIDEEFIYQRLFIFKAK